MTVLKRVTQAEMKKRTGFGKALGYSFPEEDEILIRKGLPKETEHKVLAHEEEHIAKGEEGPLLELLIPAAVSIFGASKASSASKRAANTAAAGSEREIKFARESRDLARADQAPYRKAGYTALDALMSLTGLGGVRGMARGVGNVGKGFVGAMGGDENVSQGLNTGIYGSGGPASAYGGIGSSFSGVGGAFNNYRPYSTYNPLLLGGTSPNGAIFDEVQPLSRAMGGNLYNINEVGPENVYSGGAVTRNPNPMTIGGKTGYVQPNIRGRALGGNINEFDMPGAYKPQPPWIPGDQAPPNSVQGGVAPSNSVPGNQAGTTAINPQTGYPNENPGGVEGGYNFMTEPGYQFRFGEGMRALERSAAARGGLLSGGFARKAIRYGQGFASNEFSNVYNRISNIAGLGQTAGTVSGNAALYGGQQMGTAAAQSAYANAAGQQASGNAWANAADDVASLPWGNVKWPWNKGDD